jgi:vacuolar-type H+-ATPase subunit H
MTTDTKHGPSTSPAGDATDEVVLEETSEDATDDHGTKELLKKARYDAFRLVTEAREEAESILDDSRNEAADIVREAEMTAESILDAARLQADDLRSKIATDTSPDPEAEASVAELEAEQQELTDRVGSLRELADQLEERFAALAAHSDTTEPEDSTPRPANGREDTDSSKPLIDYSPAVAPPQKEDAATSEADDSPTEERGSFYSRRSANLPRIGDAGGKSALDMMRSIRESFDDDRGS